MTAWRIGWAEGYSGDEDATANSERIVDEDNDTRGELHWEQHHASTAKRNLGRYWCMLISTGRSMPACRTGELERNCTFCKSTTHKRWEGNNAEGSGPASTSASVRSDVLGGF